MQVSFVPFQDELDDLIDFMTSNIWPYHGSQSTESDVRRGYENGSYGNDSLHSFWIFDQEQKEKIGFIRLMDVTDPIVVIDLRIAEKCRGRGVGKQALSWIVSHVFQTYPDVIRIEGHTRVDNYAMRAAFTKHGLFVLEAYHRKAWRQANTLFDSVCYAVIREDWEQNKCTQIPWNTTTEF